MIPFETYFLTSLSELKAMIAQGTIIDSYTIACVCHLDTLYTETQISDNTAIINASEELH